MKVLAVGVAVVETVLVAAVVSPLLAEFFSMQALAVLAAADV